MIFMCVGSMDQTEHRQFLSLFIFIETLHLSLWFKIKNVHTLQMNTMRKVGIRARKIIEWMGYIGVREELFFTFFLFLNERRGFLFTADECPPIVCLVQNDEMR